MTREPDLFDHASQPEAPEDDEGPRLCAHCGQRVRKLNPHHMDRQKVRMLELLAMARLAGADWVRVEAGREIEVGGRMVKAPYCAQLHAMRLLWFGLVDHGERRSGEYRINKAGADFITGNAHVPAVIYCRDGVVVKRSEKLVTVRDARGVVLDEEYWANYHAVQVHDWRFE